MPRSSVPALALAPGAAAPAGVTAAVAAFAPHVRLSLVG